MTDNLNGKITVESASVYPNVQAGCLLGISPDDVSTRTFTVTFGITTKDSVLNFEFLPTLNLRKIVKDANGVVISNDLVINQPIVSWLGNNFYVVTEDDAMVPIVPPRYFFMPRALLSPTPIDRMPTLPGQTFSLTAQAQISGLMEAGTYQMEFILLKYPGAAMGRILLPFDVRDANSVFEGGTTVWYHLI